MAINRIYICMLIVFLHFFSILAANSLLSYNQNDLAAIENEANQWIEKYLPRLDHETIQAIANLFYFSYISADMQMQFQYMTRSAIEHWEYTHAQQIHNYDHNHTIDLQKKLDYAQDLAKMFNDIFSSWKIANNYFQTIDDQQYIIAQEALTAFKEYEQHIYNISLDTNKEALNAILAEAQYTYLDVGEIIRKSANSYRSLRQEENKKQDLDILESISSVNNTVINQCSRTKEINKKITNFLVSLTDIKRIICMTYYGQIIRWMQKNLTNNYLTRMFNMRGIIPGEERIELLAIPKKINSEA